MEVSKKFLTEIFHRETWKYKCFARQPSLHATYCNRYTPIAVTRQPPHGNRYTATVTRQLLHANHRYTRTTVACQPPLHMNGAVKLFVEISNKFFAEISHPKDGNGNVLRANYRFTPPAVTATRQSPSHVNRHTATITRQPTRELLHANHRYTLTTVTCQPPLHMTR